MSLRRPPLTVLYREEEHHLITPKWAMKARFLIQPLLTQVREIPHHSWVGWELSLFPHPGSVGKNRTPGSMWPPLSPQGMCVGSKGVVTLNEVKALHPTWLSVTPFQHEYWAPHYSLKRLNIYFPYSPFVGGQGIVESHFFLQYLQ